MSNYKLVVVLITSLIAITIILAEAQKQPDLIDVLANSPDHKTLVQLLKSAGAVDELRQPGPYTVFAPTDEAFRKMPKNTLRYLQKPENRNVLRYHLFYHVAKGAATTTDIMKLKSPFMVKSRIGLNLRIAHNNKTVMVNSAKIIKADVAASNGVIHVIDQVLRPPKQKLETKPALPKQ